MFQSNHRRLHPDEFHDFFDSVVWPMARHEKKTINGSIHRVRIFHLFRDVDSKRGSIRQANGK